MGWIANVLLISGVWFAGSRWKYAFLVMAGGSALWAIEGVRLGMPDLVTINTILGAISLRNFWKLKE
jgi:hypothetical protein